MKNSKFYWNDKNEKVEVWSEEINCQTDYWEKINGISYPLSKEEYDLRMKKNQSPD